MFVTFQDAIQQTITKQTPQSPSKVASLTFNLMAFQVFRPHFVQSLTTYTSLKSLQITHCDLRNLKRFPDMLALQQLKLSNNSLLGSFQNIMPLTNLLYLDVSYNKISDLKRMIPLRRLKKLEVYAKFNPFEKIEMDGLKDKLIELRLKFLNYPKGDPLNNPPIVKIEQVRQPASYKSNKVKLETFGLDNVFKPQFPYRPPASSTYHSMKRYRQLNELIKKEQVFKIIESEVGNPSNILNGGNNFFDSNSLVSADRMRREEEKRARREADYKKLVEERDMLEQQIRRAEKEEREMIERDRRQREYQKMEREREKRQRREMNKRELQVLEMLDWDYMERQLAREEKNGQLTERQRAQEERERERAKVRQLERQRLANRVMRDKLEEEQEEILRMVGSERSVAIRRYSSRQIKQALSRPLGSETRPQVPSFDSIPSHDRPFNSTLNAFPTTTSNNPFTSSTSNTFPSVAPSTNPFMKLFATTSNPNNPFSNSPSFHQVSNNNPFPRPSQPITFSSNPFEKRAQWPVSTSNRDNEINRGLFSPVVEKEKQQQNQIKVQTEQEPNMTFEQKLEIYWKKQCLRKEKDQQLMKKEQEEIKQEERKQSSSESSSPGLEFQGQQINIMEEDNSSSSEGVYGEVNPDQRFRDIYSDVFVMDPIENQGFEFFQEMEDSIDVPENVEQISESSQSSAGYK